MTRNRLKISILRLLRDLGVLCKKTTMPSNRLRITSTVYPNGDIVIRDKNTAVSDIATQHVDIQIEQHIWIQSKKAATKDCKFDSAEGMCQCGIDLDDFATSGCFKNTHRKQ